LPSPPEECCDGQLLSLHMCITADTAPETQDANYKTDVFLFPCPPRTVFRGCDTCIEFMSRTDMVDGGEHRINDGVSSLALLLGPDDMQCVVSHLNEWNCTVKWTASKEAHCAAQGMESAGCAIAGAIRTIGSGVCRGVKSAGLAAKESSMLDPEVVEVPDEAREVAATVRMGTRALACAAGWAFGGLAGAVGSAAATLHDQLPHAQTSGK